MCARGGRPVRCGSTSGGSCGITAARRGVWPRAFCPGGQKPHPKFFPGIEHMSSLLVRLFGWRATLHHGDALVWDRWRWIKQRLRYTRNSDRLLDVGCGSGAFTIGTAKLGYNSLGLSWDVRNQKVAEERARITGAKSARFEICDVRQL